MNLLLIKLIVIVLVVLLLAVKVFCGPIKNDNRFIPPEGKTLLIVGQYKEAIDTYVEELGHIPAGLMVYTSVQHAEGIYEAFDHGGGAQHLQYEVEQYPNTVMQVGLYMVDVLKEILDGVYDENLQKLGNWIKNSDRPVYLRIGYEFDGPHNHYDPQLYVKAYRYIADKFQAMSINNVAYVWHSYANHTKIPIMDWYPGDEYVDWIALSYFSNMKESLESVAEIAKTKNKPLMIAEATPCGIGVAHDKHALARWYEPFFKFIEYHDVKAVSYINCDWEALAMWKGQGWKDSRVQANPVIKKRWLEEVEKEKYLKSTPQLFRLLGFEAKNKKSAPRIAR